VTVTDLELVLTRATPVVQSVPDWALIDRVAESSHFVEAGNNAYPGNRLTGPTERVEHVSHEPHAACHRLTIHHAPAGAGRPAH